MKNESLVPTIKSCTTIEHDQSVNKLQEEVYGESSTDGAEPS